MKKKHMMLLAMAVATLPIMAATEVVDGITWTYKVSSGKASVDGGSYSKPAVPITTTGNLTIPAMLGGYPVTSIGSYAFRNCIGLTRVTIGAGVTSIGSSAFSGCGALMSVMISNSVKEIGDNAFAGCTSLEHVSIPAAVKELGYQAFFNCTALRTIYFQGVPPHITSHPVRAASNVPQAGVSAGDNSLPDNYPECYDVFYKCETSAVGYYPEEFAAAWNVVLNSNGKWQGLAMRKGVAGNSLGDGSGSSGLGSGSEGSSLDGGSGGGGTGASSATEEVQQKWYASLSNKREATSVTVGGENWNASDKDKPLPYRFSCGAVLRATAGSLRLDLNNTIITNGIYANGDFAILLSGNNYVDGGILIVYGTETSMPLLIFGYGSLTITGGLRHVISSSELAICAGASVTVHDTALFNPTSGRKLLVSGSVLSIYTPDKSATQFDNINIIGSVVTICAKNRGLWADGGNVVIDGSVVNVLSQNDRAINTKTLVCQHSYLSCVSCSDYGISTTESHFDNSLAKVYSKSGATINTDRVVFGEGDYYVVCGHPPMPTWSADLTRAVWANDMIINGGNVQTCSVGAYDDSCAVDAGHFRIDAGRLEIVDKVDVREFLKYDAATAAAFTGALASGIDVTSLMANFYSQVILDAISNGKIGDEEGVPNVGMRCETYTQDCGTVWCDLSKYGTVMSYSYSPVINGGSYKGWFKYYWSDDPISPLDSAGNMLKSVPYAVAGSKKYEKITQSWSGVLPSYYGTGSLYADEVGKLYFWVPENWNVPGGGTDTTNKPDLVPYTPSGWSAPVVVAKDASSTTDATGITENDNLYLKFAVVCRGMDVTSEIYFTLYVDGEQKTSWRYEGYLTKDDYVFNTSAFALGKLSAGTHTFKFVADSVGAVAESDEGNNVYIKTITVGAVSFVVTFNPNGGTGIMDNQTIAIGKVAKLNPCAFTAPAGKRFAGWRRTDNGRRYDDGMLVFNLASEPGAVIVLEAVWE